MKFTNEMIEKAKELKSVKELLAFMKDNGDGLTKEQAEILFARLHYSGELADDELEKVDGGFYGEVGGVEYNDEKIKGGWQCCPKYICRQCGAASSGYNPASISNGRHDCPGSEGYENCFRCKYAEQVTDDWVLQRCTLGVPESEMYN